MRPRRTLSSWVPRAGLVLWAMAILRVSALSASRPDAISASHADQQVFRASTDVVLVDVGVRSNGDPIAGLSAKDFVLTDNGVRQTIDSVSSEAVPVDVTILLDNNGDVADDLKGMIADVNRIAEFVRPTDRLRITSIGTYVTDLIPAQPAGTVARYGPWPAEDLSSAFDGLAAALLRPVEPDRKHLIIAITNGIDAISTLDVGAVRDIARRSTATLHIAQVDMARDGEPLDNTAPTWRTGIERITAARQGPSGTINPVRTFWRPVADYQNDALIEIAESTGGALYAPGVFTNRNAAAIFKKAFEDYRRRYVLRYTRTGVARDGWHEIAVAIPAHAGYDISARKGYAVDPATPSPGAAPAPAKTPAAVGIDDITAAYGAGDYRAALTRVAGVRTPADLIRDFREMGNPWPGAPHRESTFVLELAHEIFSTRRPGADRTPPRKLIEDHRQLVRGPFAPTPFERLWLLAAIAIAEGANEPAMADSFAQYALTRFPNEPRFVLARAVAKDLEKPNGSLAREANHVRDTSARYDAAMVLPEVAAEARVRKAWLLYRTGARQAEALALLNDIDDPTDAYISYLRHVMRGRILASLDRVDESVMAYRAAQMVAPAQSSGLGLMAMLLRQGDRAGAEAEATRIETMPANAGDPWWAYKLGEYWRYPDIIRRLRELSR